MKRVIINTDFGKNDDVALFRRKRGQHDWDWENCGTYMLSKDGLIDMVKFLESDGYTVFDDFDEYLEYNRDVVTENYDDGELLTCIDFLKHMEEIHRDFVKYGGIIVQTDNGDVWVEDRYRSSYVDDNSYEWSVGVEDEV